MLKIASIQVQANDILNYQQATDTLLAKVREAAGDHDLVLVPECAFPAYYLEPREGDISQILAKGQELVEQIKEIARQTGTYIAFGYAETDNDSIYNTALLVDRSGKEVVKKRKSYLWHFDHYWFKEGEDLAVADTDFGRVGLVVCCDARSPEIVRLAALAGADLIIDLANLTATGPNIAELHNAQSAYMLSVRALENGVWLAVSDKWGVETNSIVYTGRSAIYGPDGACHGQAGSDRDEIVSAVIPTGPDGKIVKRTARALPVRRPELYSLLAEPTNSLPITTVIEQPVTPAAVTPYVTAVAGELSEQDYLNMIRRLTVHGSWLIAMPPSKLSIDKLQEQICRLIPQGVIVVATMIEQEAMQSYFLSHQGRIAVYENAHKAGCQPFVQRTPWGNIGIMQEEEGLIPEWSRVLMLAGADCVVWPNTLPSAVATPIARTRAAENRIFLIVAQSGAVPSLAQIIDPGGVIIASTLTCQPKQACGSYACFANSRMKNIVPGTHVVYNRHPEQYKKLTARE